MDKKAMKVPKVLAALGRVVEIKGEKNHYYFPKSDGVIVAATPDGKTLWCFRAEPKKITYEQFSEAWEARTSQAEQATQLYETWNDFDTSTGSLISAPKGFLFRVDRCKAIIYESAKWTGRNARYIHEFRKKPLIWVNKQTAPTVLELSGGKIQTTARGITG